MSNVLSEQELKAIAEELGVEFTEAKTMYERALASGTMFSAKEFGEALKATNLGGAIVTGDDDEDEKDKTLKEIIEELSDEEFKDLADIVEETTKARCDDAETSTKMKPKKGVNPFPKKGDEEEDEEDEDMKEVKKDIQTLGEMVAQQTKAISDLANALAGEKGRQELGVAVQDFFADQPRKQAAGFVTGKSADGSETVPDDETVMAKLKAIDEKLNAQMLDGKSFYDNFTSTQLNKGRAQ